MSILNRYIIREILTYFTISLFALTGILLVLRMLKFANLIINRGVDPSQIVQVFISIIPTFLEIAIPLACLLGVMLAFSRMSGDSELVVMRASGISLFQILKPVVIFSFFVTLLGFYVSIELRPWGFRSLSQTLFEIARSRSTSGLSPGIFNPLGDLTLYAESIDYSNGNLERVLIDDRRDPALRRIIVSKHGRILSDDANQNITLHLVEGVAHEQQSSEKYVLTDFDQNDLVMTPDEIFKSDTSKKGVQQREASTAVLKGEIQRLKPIALSVHDIPEETFKEFPELENLSASQITKRYQKFKIEYGQRFSLPCASFVMALLGMALGILPPRAQKTWGAGLSTTLGLLVFVIYYSLFTFGLALAEQGNLKIWIALWIPNAALLLIACYFLYHVASEKWQSVTQGLRSRISFRRKKL